jgi:hypothetical protein
LQLRDGSGVIAARLFLSGFQVLQPNLQLSNDLRNLLDHWREVAQRGRICRHRCW